MRGSVKSRLESGPSAAQVLSLTPSRKGSRTVLGEENMVASLRGPVSLDAVGDAAGVGLQMFVNDDFRKEVLAEVRDPYLRNQRLPNCELSSGTWNWRTSSGQGCSTTLLAPITLTASKGRACRLTHRCSCLALREFAFT